MKKFFIVFILILLCMLNASVCAEAQFLCSFESESDSELWSGGLLESSTGCESESSLFVSNPFGEIKNERVTHVIDYSSTVELDAGKVYTLSGAVMDPLSAHSSTARAGISLGAGSNTIIVNVTNIGDDWSNFSVHFFAGESGSYNLSLHFAEGYADFGFFVDNLTLTEKPCTLSTLNLSGYGEILIPAAGSVKNYYRPYLLTTENETVEILSSSNINFSVTEAQGISFDSREFSLTVSSEAQSDSTLFVSCAIRNYAFLAPVSRSVILTDNMIDNAQFDSENTHWESSSKIQMQSEGNNSFISVPTNDYGDFGYFATISYNTPQLLLENVLYVIRAKIKSDNPKPFSAIYAKNSAEVRDNTVFFNIKDISGEEWIDVFAAFVPEKSGVYDIALNFCSTYDCTIYADSIKLSGEMPSPEYITLHAPGNIALSNVYTDYPVSALLRDQLGNIIDSDEIQTELLGSPEHINFNSEKGTLTVHPDTPAGSYTIMATYIPDPSIKAYLTFDVSYDFICDGAFEKTVPNERWMVTSPFESDFYIRNDGHSMRALINCRGNYFMLLNNSYIRLFAGMPYVFNSNFAVPVDCTATLFLEKLGGEVLPLSQIFIRAGTTLDEKLSPELFLAEEDAVGRPFLYIESDNGQPFSIYADNLSLKSASILAVNPHITGIPFVNGAAQAEFTLFNNISDNSDTSSCAINWYVSDSKQGNYKEVQNAGKNIYFDTTFLNKYVYFEVIPICSVTGFSGNAIRSLPLLITYEPSGGEANLPQFTPTLKNPPVNENYFSDTSGHWGEKYINTLAYSQVVSGKNKDLFMPDDNITRAEFAKFLSLSFSIKTVADLQSFADVSRNDWHYSYVTALHLSGIINGAAPGYFLPDMPLTRQEAAVMMIRLYEKATALSAPAQKYDYYDSDEISAWASESIKKASGLGIMQGNPDGAFAPLKNLTRAEAAALICRLWETVVSKKG